MKILVTSGNWDAALVVMRELARRGHEVHLLDHDRCCAGFRSRYCAGGIVTPPEQEASAYIAAVLQVVHNGHFDLLVPISDMATELLSEYREQVLPFTRMLLPANELVTLARFKDRTYRFALAHDIPIPHTYFPQSLLEVVRVAEVMPFPCVVKKPRGTANKGNRYFYAKEGLLQYFEGCDPSQAEWPVVQEFIDGDFYGFLGVAREGKLLDCIMFRTDWKYTLNGTPPYCSSIRDDRFLQAVQRIIRLLDWTGAINLDFLRDKAGQWRLLEINPRLSGTLALSCCLNVDLVGLYVGLALGRAAPPAQVADYPDGIRFRFLFNEIIYVCRNQQDWLKLLGNFFNVTVRSDIPWSDPLLLLWKVKHLRWHLLKMGGGRRTAVSARQYFKNIVVGFVACD